MWPVFEQFDFWRVVSMAASHNNQAFQLDVSREWNIKKAFLVSVRRDHLEKESETGQNQIYQPEKNMYINGFLSQS